MKRSITIGIIQENPIYLNIIESMDKAVELIKLASDMGAELIVFGESWLTGYPAWLDNCPEAALWDHEPTKEIFARMFQNSIEVPGKETAIISECAKKHQLIIGIGVNEIVKTGIGNGTIYNSFLIFNNNGELANHHRKLMPTYTEKLVYGTGDANGLKTIETEYGRIGGLICWEHWMPFPRQALHNCGEHIHLAVWPTVNENHQLASRHYAFEGRCYVISVGQIMFNKELPNELKIPKQLKNKPDKMLLNGGSCIIGPDGKFILKPQFNKKGIIIQEIEDLERVVKEKMTLDTAGHYNRNDIFNFSFNAERKK